jgi:hypothetical protein
MQTAKLFLSQTCLCLLYHIAMLSASSAQFLGQDVHFAIYLFAALACFAAGWLYFDAWTERRHLIDLPKWAGFFLLAVGLLVSGAVWDGASLIDITGNTLQFLGYVGLVIGNLLEPIQPLPETTKLLAAEPAPAHPAPAPAKPAVAPAPAPTPSAAPAAAPAPAPTAPTPATPPPPATSTAPAKPLPAILLVAQVSGIALPLSALTIAALYWRRATIGLERHLKPIAGVFLALALANGFALAKLWRTTDNPLVQSLVDPMGPFWFLEHIAMLVAGVALMWWVWRYLTKRFLTQLFLTITSFTVSIVLVATVSITGLLITSLQKDSLASLQTAAKVLNYAIKAKTSETRSNAMVQAQNPAVSTALSAGDHATLARLSGDLLAHEHLSDVIITSDSGQVMVRASDPDRYGDSLSDDSLIKRALTGATASSIAVRSGVLASELIITTASPVRNTNRIIGVSLASLALDNAFVDGIKQTTGLDSAVYAGSTRAATTLVAPDGTSRSIGAKETRANVLDTTLRHGQIWSGSLTVSNQNYLATYLPLKDVDNTVVGMLFVGQLKDTILHSAEEAVKLTFIAAVIWLLIIMFPIYLISRLIARQLH